MARSTAKVRPSHSLKQAEMSELTKKLTQESSLPKGRGLCLRCGDVKEIYRTEIVCEDCWIGSVGKRNIYVSCPRTKLSSSMEHESDTGTHHLKNCYHCPYRKGWDSDNSPLCRFPAPVAVLSTPDGQRAMCPRNLAREGYGVKLELCRICEDHAWIDVDLDGRRKEWIYCSLPRAVKLTSRW